MYRFEMITGPMGCGKTEELFRRIRRSILAKKHVKVITPEMDTRAKGDYIESRNGLWLEAVKESDDIVAIDELQFFDEGIISVVKKLIMQGKKVIGSGLDLDFKGDPFGYMPELLCMADKVDKLCAVCLKCGCETATRTQRLINGKPVDKNSPLIMIGGDETYEARCYDCWELPDIKTENRKRGFKLLNFQSK